MDKTFYFVECAFRSGNAFVEMERHRMSRQQIVDDILHGQYTDVVTVIECNPVEHICDDITEDVLAEVAALRDDEPRLTGQNLQDALWDHARADRQVGVMSVSVSMPTLHGVHEIRASVLRLSNGVLCLRVHVSEYDTVAIFFEGPDAERRVDAYAKAINSVLPSNVVRIGASA